MPTECNEYFEYFYLKINLIKKSWGNSKKAQNRVEKPQPVETGNPWKTSKLHICNFACIEGNPPLVEKRQRIPSVFLGTMQTMHL